MKTRKGIILAGGTGSRLFPATLAVNKHLLPIYDKPMIFYSLSVLMLSGIREILLISSEKFIGSFQDLLGDGARYGVKIDYASQEEPRGIAEGLIIAKDFLTGGPSALVLGDNIFFGSNLIERLKRTSEMSVGATCFACPVADPERFGIVSVDSKGKALKIEEKPTQPASNLAITGLYFFDGSASDRAALIMPSARGELEITDVLASYLSEQNLRIEQLGRGYAWLDAGTHASFLEASEFVRTLQIRQGLQVACLEEIAFNNGWLSIDDLVDRASDLSKSNYGSYLAGLAREYFRSGHS